MVLETGADLLALRELDQKLWVALACPVQGTELDEASLKLIDTDGKGMDERELERAKDPFYTDGTKHARRKVGLGLPFLIQATEQAGGDFRISSRKGSGTRVSFGFPVDGVDTPPLGDLPGLFLSAMCFDGDYELVIRRRAPARGVDYEIRRSEILEAAGPLDDASALVAVREFLASHEAS